jgi:pimeloyl-ACP methyl ester carboxylesterase
MRVALVHGTMDRGSSFAKVARRLDGFETLTFDRAGYGGRVGEPVPEGRGRVAADVADLLAHLGADGPDGPVTVIGHSYGGHVALAASIARPDLVVAVGAYETPVAWLPTWPARTSGGLAAEAGRNGSPADAAEVFMRSIVGDAIWDRLPPSTKAARRAEGPAMLADLRDIQSLPPPYDLAAVPVPVVIGRGTESKGHHREGTKALLAVLPDAELHLVEGAGHGGHTSHPDGFAAFVRAAIARA